MLWWLAGLWLASPVLVPFFWLLGCLRRDARRPQRGGSHHARSALSPGLTATSARATTRT